MAETKQPQFSVSDGSAVAQQPTQQSAPASPPQPAPRPCPQNCALCGTQQQVYCTTKMLFDLSRAYQEARQQIAAVEKAVADIRTHLEAKDETPLSTPVIESS